MTLSRPALLAAVFLGVGCPKKGPQVELRPAGAPPAPTLLSRWSEVDLSQYGELVAGSGEGLSIRRLARAHDLDRFATHLVTWGPPERWVLQAEDQVSPDSAAGAIGGWVLAGAHDSFGAGRPVDWDDLLHGEPAGWIVSSVLLRDFADAPSAADPFDLLLEQASALPAPWTVCRPRDAAQKELEEAEDADLAALASVTDPTALYAYDPDRGTRIALLGEKEGVQVPLPGDGPFTWRIDHLAFAPAARPVAKVWPALGLVDCVEIGKVLSEDRARRPKSPLGPPQ